MTQSQRPYILLPFRFDRLSENEYFISNEVGEYYFIPKDDFDRLVHYELPTTSPIFSDLKAKQVATDTDIAPVAEMLATKYRTKKSFLDNFTALHMVVPTLRCNSNCTYCQVSRKDVNTREYDMTKKTAKRVVGLVFESPSPVIKIEFQGGEPLLNFEIVKYIIEYAEWCNIFKKRELEFVICTNLTLMTDKILKYLKGHKAYISTSLDGPKELHNLNRPLQETKNTYDILIGKIELCRKYLGQDSVSALMTTSINNLKHLKEVIDEYLARGFRSIFIRSLNPYGFAKRDKKYLSYEASEFTDEYKKALNYIIEQNLKGRYLVEGFASLLLTRILTPFSTGFVDMQSPAGVAISGVIYDYDGNVYVADEARMLASMGDKKFLMGNVRDKTYQELFNSEFTHSLISGSCLEALPMCARCGYQSYCGADPVRNYSEQGDIIGNRPMSEACKKNMHIIKYLFELIRKNDDSINRVFWAWINRQPELLKTSYHGSAYGI